MKKSKTFFGMLVATIMFSGMQSVRAQRIMLVSGSVPEVKPGEMLVSASDPQVKDDLLAGTEKFAQGASDVTDVNLDGHMLGMMGKQTAGDVAKKLDFIVVRSYTYDKPGMYKQEDLEGFQKKLTDGSWNCFVHVRERKSGESTDICSRQAADHETNELIIVTAEPKELTFVHLRGRMTLDDLRNLGGNMGGGSGSSSGAGSGSGSGLSKHE